MKHYSFPSIQQFKNVRRNVQHKAQYRGVDEAGELIMDRTAVMPVLEYEGTVKLHGTNAGVIIKRDGSFYCQSRERLLTVTDDNAGFAWYIHSMERSLDLTKLIENFPAHWETMAVYFEWAGGSIQKGVALNGIEKKAFLIGARLINGDGEKEEWLDVRDWALREGGFLNIYNFPTFRIGIDFEEPIYAVEQINKWVLEVEAECPVGKHFGVSGVGEGLVFKPIGLDYNNSGFWFKAKGDKHSQSHVKKLATVDVEKFESQQAFVNSVLEEGRLEQGYNWLKENGKTQDEKSTGDFIRWVYGDVLKECKLEMEENKIEPKELGKLLSGPAKKWFFNRLNECNS
jgi:hypothetical protein